MANEKREDTEIRSREKPMEVLVLGLSRTGTSSTRQALKDLGHERVYHTYSVIFDEPTHGDIWVEAFKAKFERGSPFRGQDWDRLFGRYTAVTDVPCAIFWKELVEAYPNAKVVLTVRFRDSTGAWYKSYRDTIDYLTQTAYTRPSLAVRFFSLFLPSHGFDRLVKYQILYTPRGRFEAEGRDWYERHNAAVIAGVPKDNLLIFNVKQGWEPLCKFLGKEVPPKPFPRIFETKQYRETLQKMRNIRVRRAVRRASVSAAVVLAVVGISWVLQLKISKL